MNTILVVTVATLLVASCAKASVNDEVSNEAAKKSVVRQYRYWTPNIYPYPPRSMTPNILLSPPERRNLRRGRRPTRPAPPQPASDDSAFIVMLFVLLTRFMAPPTTTPSATTMMTETTTTTTTPACTVTWGAWTICNSDKLQYRSRVCPTGTETQQWDCTIELACTVDWGAWTTCNLAGLQYRSRVCPTGTETEQRDCSIDCLEWSDWSTCASNPIVVDEKQTRTRQCNTGYETESEDCHTSATIGYTSDNWYRAGNGYEYYYIASELTYTAALSTCESIDSTAILASVAARSGLLGEAGFDADGLGVPDGDLYFIGASDSITEDTWIFLDGEVRTSGALTWGNTASPQPNDSNESQNCMIWVQDGGSNTAEGLGDQRCGSREPAMCERKVA